MKIDNSMHSTDCLAVLIRELQIEGFKVPIHDADRREQWFKSCAVVLGAIKDPQERLDQLTSFAMGFAIRGIPSEMVMKKLEGR